MTEAQICLLMSEDLNRNETSTVDSIQCNNKPWRLLGKYSASPAYEFLNSFFFFFVITLSSEFDFRFYSMVTSFTLFHRVFKP